MAIQLSTAVRNARLNAIEATVGPSGKVKILSGSMPANCAASDTGTVLSTIDLPADWMQDAAGGAKTMSGTWKDNSADASGTASYYRVYAADGTTCHLQGSVTATGGGGDMTVDNVVFAVTQEFSITSFSLNDNNA
ncbi:hypothetical protein [Antarcticirhabdus aurantiaca]|uniref:Uncharacterized protein n=1 Tax=Antarcticirhabdus aurantiaca TaxID=2606717 RepID=A0ACD4NQW7_9HYPH|nr:hypothetical protein OXU80_03635 [Jeongeuplla avenae]